jgi:hypothetical protein
MRISDGDVRQVVFRSFRTCGVKEDSWMDHCVPGARYLLIM